MFPVSFLVLFSPSTEFSIKSQISSKVWCLIPVIPALKRLRQKAWSEWEASLSYIYSMTLEGQAERALSKSFYREGPSFPEILSKKPGQLALL